jgi:hypothetical protein
MSTSRDWLSNSRAGQLAMAKDWKAVVTPKQTPWNIPAAALTDLDALIQAAEAALTLAQNEITRTPVATAQCKEAFDALTAAMRDMKRRYFLTPPLADSDYIALGLKPHDATPTASGTPSAQVTIETYLVGRHELGVKIIYVTGNPADPANKGYRVYYKTVAHGETPPRRPRRTHPILLHQAEKRRHRIRLRRFRQNLLHGGPDRERRPQRPLGSPHQRPHTIEGKAGGGGSVPLSTS